MKYLLTLILLVVAIGCTDNKTKVNDASLYCSGLIGGIINTYTLSLKNAQSHQDSIVAKDTCIAHLKRFNSLFETNYQDYSAEDKQKIKEDILLQYRKILDEYEIEWSPFHNSQK